LVEPSTREITSVSGFAASDERARGHEQGTTSADEGGDFIFAIDRSTKLLDVVDPKQRKIVATAPLAGSPDYVRWVEATREVWVTEPDDERIEVFSATGAPKVQHSAFIKVEGGPESLVIDAKRQRAFTHLWKSTSVAVDLRTRSIVAKWQNGCSGSRGIAVDEARGFLFVGCSEGKAAALAVDHEGKILSTLTTGSGVDVIAYSPTKMHLYVPGAKSATLTIARVSPSGELTSLGVLPTAKGAHCVTADDREGIWVCRPESGDLLYFADGLP
jgi:DNA-binding beta-propeller fold protein YncE